jgi:hypothetical protein
MSKSNTLVPQTIGEEESGGYLDPVKLEAFIKKKFPGREYKILVELPHEILIAVLC